MIDKPKNIKAAKKLIKKYRSITVEDIKKAHEEFPFQVIANRLTGIGDYEACPLCTSINHNCEICIYQGFNQCTHDENAFTYFRIQSATNPRQLVIAFKARADHIENLLTQWEDEE